MRWRSQLSLRNLSGIIIVDFIDMESKEDQEALDADAREKNFPVTRSKRSWWI